MLKITTSMKVARKGDMVRHLQKMQAALKSPEHAVRVGFPAGKAPTDVVQVAIWNHFGTRGGASGGGWGGPVPARPFITAAIWNNRQQLRAQIRAIALGIVQRGENPRIGLGRLGQYATGLVQGEIVKGVPPPNSPVTIKLKGSSKPLVDTGRLKGAVTWDYA